MSQCEARAAAELDPSRDHEFVERCGCDANPECGMCGGSGLMELPDPRQMFKDGEYPEWLLKTSEFLRLRALITRYGWDVVKESEGIEHWSPGFVSSMALFESEIERLRFERDVEESRARHLKAKASRK